MIAPTDVGGTYRANWICWVGCEMEELRSLANSCWVVELVVLVVAADAISVALVAGDDVDDEESLPSPTTEALLPPPPPVLRG
jgi:hypothetical protein